MSKRNHEKHEKHEHNGSSLKTIMDEARKHDKDGATLVDVKKGNMTRKHTQMFYSH